MENYIVMIIGILLLIVAIEISVVDKEVIGVGFNETICSTL